MTSTPAPAHPVRWADTPAGRAEAWIKPKVMQVMGSREDFPGAVHALGIKKAARMMRREIEEQGRYCPNHAQNAL